MSVLHGRHLSWDTNFFQFKVAEILAGSHSVSEIHSLLNTLQKQKYVLVYIFSPHEIAWDTGLVHPQFIFQKRVYQKKVDPEASIDPSIHRFDADYPTDAMLNLAVDSGIFSRFNIDSKIETRIFEKLYLDWMINSVSHAFATDVLTYDLEGKTVGVVTLNKKDSIGEIGLIAVNKRYRQKRIGSKLLTAAEYYFNRNQLLNMRVVTQDTNKPACSMYKKYGFIIHETLWVYHAWL
jgi:ribosomal protein S18 acetylase RimI-like enzyme